MTMPYVGMDVGSIFFKAVIHDGNPDWPAHTYRPHHGNPQEVFRQSIEPLLRQRACRVALTGSHGEGISARLTLKPVDTVKSVLAAVRERYPSARNVIDIGGGSVTLIRLDEEAHFRTYATNSLCAAGTGSFLDEQAERLGVDYADMAKFTAISDPPAIATRCSVFAKSDLIHRQQEGCSREEMWAGLCRGMTTTMLQTLLKGSPLKGQTVIVGGVAQNQVVLYWLERMSGVEVKTFEDAHLAAAQGAVLLCKSDAWPAEIRGNADLSGLKPLQKTEAVEANGNRAPKLLLNKSRYPSFDVVRQYIDDEGTEVRCHTELNGGELRVVMGIDVGSTSTKAVLIDDDGKVILDLYRKTLGAPIQATKHLFTAIKELMANTGATVTVTGCGTTGSGRKLVGAVVGADRVINEISAHVAGAMAVDPTIDTIFEIGGQDSKYMRTVGGRIADSNMNYVCAAGTGSFVEEQARKLGFDIREVGAKIEGIAPPKTSDRCTVFMEQDVHRLLRQGYSKQEAMAAVLYSVVQNYLNRVVGNRSVNRQRIFFQGATARNKALVAAFENLLNVEVTVSPLCHQMGAYGVALLTARSLSLSGDKTRFFGLDLNRRKITMDQEVCEFCANECRITFADIEGVEERPSWGYACGRDPDDTKVKKTRTYDLFRKRKRLLNRKVGPRVSKDGPIVDVPMTLSMYTYLPFWRAFLATLGYRVRLSGNTDAEIARRGAEITGSDFCHPVKIAHGHVRHSVESGARHVLVPAMISEANDSRYSTNSLFCPYLEGLPGYVKSALELAGHSDAMILRPVVDFRWDGPKAARELTETIGPQLGASPGKLAEAWKQGLEAQQTFARACQAEGKKALDELAGTGRHGLVILGRTYNTCDPGANLDLPRTIAETDHVVIPLDMMPFSQEMLPHEFRNIYWAYGQRILCAARHVADNPHLNAIYLTNFSCGPDSFLLTYVEKLMGAKPMLTLELDEHGSDGGYQTRLEAFLDVLKRRRHEDGARRLRFPDVNEKHLDGRKVWCPPLHPIGARLFAAAFRRHGFDSEMLPVEDETAFEIGRRVTRGAECLPTAVTIGALIKKLRELDADPKKHAFFMATATGPCRFGQYSLLHRIVLDQEGYADVPILAPGSHNSYQGISEPLRRSLWEGIIAGDVLYKLRCKVKPYELHPGTTEALTEEFTRKLDRTMERGEDLGETLREAGKAFLQVPTDRSRLKPLVGVVGEIYVRCNTFCNEDVVRVIEDCGGEAWLAPVCEWFMYTMYMNQWLAKRAGLWTFLRKAPSLLLNLYMTSSERYWTDLGGPLLSDRHEPPMDRTMGAGAEYLDPQFEGEAIITVGRAVEFARQGATMVINCSPFGCMPGATTTAIFQSLQETIGVPILNMFYDGAGDLNRRIAVFMANLTDGRPLPADEARRRQRMDEARRRRTTVR